VRNEKRKTGARSHRFCAPRFALQLVRDQIGRRVYPVHRLDRPTSGVLLFALDGETARQVNGQFCSGAVEKTYLAVVRGYTEKAGLIDYALQEQQDRMTDALADSDKPAQPAVTGYRRLATGRSGIRRGAGGP